MQDGLGKDQIEAELLSAADTQTVLGVCRSMLYKLERGRELIPLRLRGRCIRFRRADIDAYIARLSAKRDGTGPHGRGRPRSHD